MKQRYVFLIMLLMSVAASASGATHPWDSWRLEGGEAWMQFQRDSPLPFFWLADTGWLLPERLDRDEAEFYLSRCADAGYNVVQVQVINGVPAFNAYGQMSMTPDFDFGGEWSEEGGGRNA